ncbi:histone acetyltransferase HPA2 [Stutzerimonas stutzeri]|uniref:DUF7931 domain-containing protein n=1 Tax=Stutzerimonas stutzeri TaxID=316 RepID=UPI00210BD4A1|nr:histone acetyltransferase HPA2 [Stutzerimonas stutzeri]MCQ4242833.1 histone acetyltransferase HPA2 [Stutzerimonas stutzeri]
MSTDDSLPSMATELAAIDFKSPGRYLINNPQQERETRPEAPAVDGSGTFQTFESLQEAQLHTLALLAQARRSICLYSPDLEPWLYNQSDIVQTCASFLLAHPRNRLRILLADPTPAVRQGHRLLTLARRLTSNMQIRTLNPDHPAHTSAFLVVDERGLLIRPEPERVAGYALYQNPGRARALRRQFDTAWEYSLSHPDLRGFLL